MTEKIPPHLEKHPSKKNPEEYSDLLDELARIRKDIEQESVPTCHLSDLGQNHSKYHENSSHSSITSEVNGDDKSLHLDSFRRLFRFDLEHLERRDLGCLNIDSEISEFTDWTKSDPAIPLPKKEFSCQTEWEPAEEKTKQLSRLSKSNSSEIKRNYYRYDDGPVLIPIRGLETRRPEQNLKFVHEKSRENHRRSQDALDQGDVVDYAAIPWGMISQYENESFANLSANAGNLSLFIGWGAIACGAVIFARSFFVGSMIWLNYGLPVVALGAACLFLGIILSILSDKMQHINDLKQSLTAHRILNPPTKKTDSPPAHRNENGDFEDVYDRLVKLRSEINELIDGRENP